MKVKRKTLRNFRAVFCFVKEYAQHEAALLPLWVELKKVMPLIEELANEKS